MYLAEMFCGLQKGSLQDADATKPKERIEDGSNQLGSEAPSDAGLSDVDDATYRMKRKQNQFIDVEYEDPVTR